MLLFAEMSTESIVAISAAVLAVAKIAEKVYDNWRLDKAARKVADKVVTAAVKVADKVEEVKAQTATDAAEVKTALETSNAAKKDHLDKQDVKLEEIGRNVNGMNVKIEQAGFARGVKSETDKGDHPDARKMKIALTLDIDCGESDTDRIRHLTEALARTNEKLRAAVAGASQPSSPHPGVVGMAAKKLGSDPNPVLDTLTATVTDIEGTADSAIALINGIQGQIDAGIAAALKGGATEAQLAPLTDLSAGLAAKNAALATAVAANTPPAPPAPPAP